MKKISAIYCYPIKGCGGISLQKASLEKEGLKYDRRWMLVDNDGKFISQRSHPEMALLNVSFDDEGLVLNYNESSLLIPLDATINGSETVTVWDDSFAAGILSEEYSDWFSNQLKTEIRIVKLMPDSNRLVNQKYASLDETVSFADGYPYLAIGEESLADLNNRVQGHMEMSRFRPNIVFSGGDAFEEDTWDRIEIGDTVFRGVKRCARCQVITIDQKTAIVGKEPLKTLAQYRREENKVFLGKI